MPSHPMSRTIAAVCLPAFAVIAVAVMPPAARGEPAGAAGGVAAASLLLPAQAAMCTRQVRRHVLNGRCWSTNVMRCCRPSGRGCRVVAHHKRSLCRR